MYSTRRPSVKPAFLFILILAGLLLAACGDITGSNNWPGLTANGNLVYVAYGPKVLAVDIASRQQVWSFPAEVTGSQQFLAAPSVSDGRVFVGDYGVSQGMFSPSVKVSIYALKDGSDNTPSTLWVADKVAKDKIIAPPVQAGDKLFVGTADNMLLALDAGSGELLWQFTTGHALWAQPVVVNEVVYVASLDKTLYALSVDTGKELWQKQFDGAIANGPAVGDGLLYVGSFDKHLRALDLATGEERWSVAATDWVWASPALADGVVYFADFSGKVYAIDAVTGKEIWSQSVSGSVQATPVVDNDKLFVASAIAANGESTNKGVLTAFAAADGRQLWQQTTLAPLYTTPVVVNGSLVVALQSEEALLILFDQDNGSQQWKMEPPAAN